MRDKDSATATKQQEQSKSQVNSLDKKKTVELLSDGLH